MLKHGLQQYKTSLHHSTERLPYRWVSSKWYKMSASWGPNSIKIHAKKGLQGATWVMQTVKLFWICRCFRHLVTASLQEVALLKLPLNQSYQKLEDISLSMTFFHWSHGAKDKDISRWRNSRRLLGYTERATNIFSGFLCSNIKL